MGAGSYVVEDRLGRLYLLDPILGRLEPLDPVEANVLAEWYEFSQSYCWKSRSELIRTLSPADQRRMRIVPTDNAEAERLDADVPMLAHPIAIDQLEMDGFGLIT